MADEIRIELVADADGAIKAVQKIVPAADKAGKKAAKSIEKPLKKAGDVISNSFAAIGAVVVTALGGKKFIDAAAAQDAAVQKLNASLRNTGVFSEETSQSLQKFASELQSQSTIGDEVVLDQLAFAQAMGASVDQSKEILSAAADMSSALGIDLNSAVRNISKTLGGYAGELGEVIPELKGLNQEQLRAGDGIELLAGKFQGFALAETKTFTGAMTQLQNTLGDAAEKIGEAVVKSPVLIKAINLISKAINNTFGKFPVENLIFRLNDFILVIADAADALSVLVKPVIKIVKVFDTLFEGAKTGFQTLVVAATTAFADLASNIPSALLPDGFAENTRMAADAAREVLDGMQVKTKETFDKIFEDDTAITESIRNKIANFALSLHETNTATEQSVEGLGSGLDKSGKKVESFKKTADAAFKTVNQMIRNTLVKGASQGIQALTQSLVLGENGFANFGKAVLGMFGQLAIQMGEFFIAQGIAQQALISNPFTAPAAMIAAGAGLIALGTILSSLGDKGGAGAGSAASAGGGAVGGGGILDTGGPLDEVIADDEEPAAIERPQQVQLVVQGSIFQTEETGKQILDILNEEFDSKGGRIAYA